MPSALSLPPVTVLVPTYNRRQLLHRALRSLSAQTYGQFEVVVVNDGGEDVRGVVDEFPTLNVRYVQHRYRKGLSATRNTGLSLAEGAVIAYLDDDDEFLPEHLQSTTSVLSTTHADVVTSGVRYIVNEVTGRVFNYQFPAEPRLLAITNFYPVIGWVHRRSLATRFGGFREQLNVCEDWDWLLRAVWCGHACWSAIPQITTVYHSDASARLTARPLNAFASVYRDIISASNGPRGDDPVVASGRRLVKRWYEANGNGRQRGDYEALLSRLYEWYGTQTGLQVRDHACLDQRLPCAQPTLGGCSRHRQSSGPSATRLKQLDLSQRHADS